MKPNPRLLSYALFLIIAFCFYYFIIGKDHDTTTTEQPPIVVAKKPKIVELSDFIIQTGNTVAYQSVDLVARVEGYLESIKFKDGSFVQKNQSLFVIEPRPYFEQLQEAKATLASKKASVEYAKSEYDRQQRMYRQNATSLNSVEKWRAKRDESIANLAQAKANVATAQINYSYTHVSAPFNGRIGRHLVDEGNLVGNGEATTLATIEEINPIYVYFNLNELDLIKLRSAAHRQGFKPKDINKIPVYVAMQNQNDFPYKGKLDFVSTGLSASTGTIQFRALLKNDNYSLLPGLFVRVRIPLSEPKPHLMIPSNAVQYDQIGAYVYVVDNTNTVIVRRVETGILNKGMRALTKGIKKDDLVIVDGLQNATPGKKVSLQMPSSKEIK